MYLTQGLHRALRTNPRRPATIFGERVHTYEDHADRVARLAAGLQALGLREGDRVALLARNSDRYAELLDAVPWANGVVVPLNIRWSATELTYALRDSGARILVVDDAFAPLVPDLLGGHHELRAVVHAGDDQPPDGMHRHEELVAAHPPVPDCRRGGDELAGILYTGGTTGFPKGVMLTPANLVTSALGGQASCPVFEADGVMLHAAPMFHAAALAGWIGQSLLGGTHVIVPAFEPVVVFTAIERHGVTATVLVPTMIQALVDHLDIGRHRLDSLRSILYGGSAPSEALLRRAMDVLPHVDLVQAYGMTELAPIATVLGPDDHRRGDRLRSAGRAAAHAEVAVVGPDGEELPPGTVGEIAVRGANVMAGYWSKPRETAEALRDGWMHTGDAGYMDEEGYLFVVDRLKDMIISGGENVYSIEVENALGRHPAVATSAVIGVPDPRWGERVHAVVVTHPGARVTEDELRAHARTLIATYKVPRTIEFADSLPLTGAGKVRKRDLQARHRNGYAIV